jgi:hypothetical protein
LILKIKCNLKVSLVNIIMSDDDAYYSDPDSENSDEESNDWYPFLIYNEFFNNTYIYKSNSKSQGLLKMIVNLKL